MDDLCCALVPASCCICSNPLLRFTRVPVCDSCWNLLTPQNGILCSRCGEDLGLPAAVAELELPPEERLCQVCRRMPPPFERAVAFGAYRDTLRSLIHALKYDGMEPVAGRLGQRLAQSVLMLEDAAASGLMVVAVPLHGSKRRQRGFNHAELLAGEAVKWLRRHRPEWNLELSPGILERQRATASQAGLSPRQRRENLRGAFFVPHPERIAGARVLVIDDIYTTGATARACSKALLGAGAAKVWVATLARAQRETILPIEAEAEIDRPMHEDVAFWDPGFKHPAAAQAP